MKKLFGLLIVGAFLLSGSNVFSQEKLSLPDNTTYKEYTKYGYIESDDDILGKTYAYLGYMEKNLDDGFWKIKIDGNETAGTSLNVSVVKKKASQAFGKGEDYFVMGFSIQPKANDPRHIETRIYQVKGKPSHVEHILITRNGDNTPKEKQVIKFDWPEE